MFPPALFLKGAAASFAQQRWSLHDYRKAHNVWDGLFLGQGSVVLQPQQDQDYNFTSSVQYLLTEAYGNRFLLFMGADSLASAASMAVVMEAAPIGCLGGTALESSVDGVIPLLGPAATLAATPNGQYLFASMGRSAWELSSMERSVAICEQLARDPGDPFLQEYAASCTPDNPALVPRPPVVSDFLQVCISC